jgi:hypothetical protein
MKRTKIYELKKGNIFYEGKKLDFNINRKLFICVRTQRPEEDMFMVGYILPYDQYKYMKGDPVTVKKSKHANATYNYYDNFYSHYLEFDRNKNIVILDEDEVALLNLQK